MRGAVKPRRGTNETNSLAPRRESGFAYGRSETWPLAPLWERVAEGRVRGPILTRSRNKCAMTVNRHAELVWLLLPKSVDFVQNAWFPTGSHELSKRVFCPPPLFWLLTAPRDKRQRSQSFPLFPFPPLPSPLPPGARVLALLTSQSVRYHLHTNV